DLLALFDARELTENNDTNFVLVEVLGEAEGAIRETDELVRHHARETRDVSDTVGCVGDGADLARARTGGLVGGDEVLQRVTDDVGADGDVCHCLPSLCGPRGPGASFRKR